MSEAENRALAEALFAALEAMDWAAVAELFTEDGVYQDMPFETDSGGTVGHEGIIAKLEVGLSERAQPRQRGDEPNRVGQLI